MSKTITHEIAAKLRAPFTPEQIGVKPKLTCSACSKKECKVHEKRTCRECGNFISPQHIHLSYVGHAEVTDRLLEIDPEWDWEPVADGPDGLPAFDVFGGIWIRLTIAGVTRLGYGAPDAGKRGPDAIKEAIGDAIRNGALRFGVALDLWGATYDKIPAPAGGRRRKADQPSPDEPTTARPEPVDETIPQSSPGAKKVVQDQHKTMHLLWRDLGMGGTEHREKRLEITAKLLGLADLNSSSEMTYEQAEYVIERLRLRVSQVGAGA
jgi:hypothetical protein